MAAQRGLVVDTGVRILDVDEGKNSESPTGKIFKADKFPLSRWEICGDFVGVFTVFNRVDVHIPDPACGGVQDAQAASDHLASYAGGYPAKFILVYCSTYIFMSLLAGALFGASSCYFLSKLIGRPIVNWLWPDKLRYFQAEIAKRKDKLLNFMLFLRVTPTLPILFINLASPIVDIPFHVFFLATVIGIIPHHRPSWPRTRRSQISERSIRCQDTVRSFPYWGVDFVTSCCIEEETGIRIEVFSPFSMEKC